MKSLIQFFRLLSSKQKTGSKSAEELTKRYLDAVLKSQCSPNDNNSTKSEDEDMESEDIVVSMTPPTSPPPISLRSTSSVSRLSNSTAATTSTLREKNITLPSAATSPPPPPSHRANSQDAPIDLSMKSSSSGSASAKAISPHNDHRDFGSDDDGAISSEDELSIDKRSLSADSRPGSRNEHEKNILENANGLRIKGTTPLDLTTKI